MIDEIKELRRTHEELGEVLEYLAVNDDGVGADWSQVVIDYNWLLQECKHRATTLRNRDKGE